MSKKTEYLNIIRNTVAKARVDLDEMDFENFLQACIDMSCEWEEEMDTGVWDDEDEFDDEFEDIDDDPEGN